VTQLVHALCPGYWSGHMGTKFAIIEALVSEGFDMGF